MNELFWIEKEAGLWPVAVFCLVHWVYLGAACDLTLVEGPFLWRRFYWYDLPTKSAIVAGGKTVQASVDKPTIF